MRNVREILSAALVLMLICACAVAALAATNALTKDTIQEQEIAATNAACQRVLTEADSFTLLDGVWQDGVESVYEATCDGTLCGYVVQTSTVGKSSGLVVMTGITCDGVVSGVEVVSANETAGYIDTVTEGGLLERLKGISGDASSVDGVSQATKSSNGIKSGVSLALATFEEVNGNG